MATPVIMPKFGMAQEDGTIIRWLKQEGDRVEKGETLLEVQTDKVDMEVESPANGVLRDIRFGKDVTVAVTTVIAVVANEADEARIHAGEPLAPALVSGQMSGPTPEPSGAPVAAQARGESRATPVAQRVAQAHGVSLEGVAGSGPAGRIVRADVERAGTFVEATAPMESSLLRATPAARRLANEAGISLTEVTGSGPSGRVQAADVQAAALESERAAPVSVEKRLAGGPPSAANAAPLRGVRRTIAKRVVQSWTTIPHIYLTSTIEMSRAEALRGLLGPEVEALGEKLTPTVLIARAVAAALSRHPRLNAHLVESGGELHLEEHESVHLGLAVALGEGLVVPVVRDAQRMGLAALAQSTGALVKRARANQLSPTDIEGGTFTISNLGAFPIDHFTALIFPPQVAILAVGRMRMQPVWDGASFAPRPTLEATLSADHRAVDGAVAAAFLADLKSLLEAPERMLL